MYMSSQEEEGSSEEEEEEEGGEGGEEVKGPAEDTSQSGTLSQAVL